MFKHIVFATDGSSASAHAATLAVGLARTHGATLTAVYVMDPYPYMGIGEANPMGFQAYMDAARGASAQAFTQMGELCAGPGGQVELDCCFVENVSATKGILQLADERNADLIVVGSHGRGGLEKLVLGSVASKVVAQSTRPVLVMR